MIVLIAGAMAFAIIQPIKVLPRLRPAPGYAMTDEHGQRFTSEDARGTITLYTFVPLDCGEACTQVDATMTEVRDRVRDEIDLGGVEFRLVTIVLDPDVATADLTAAARHAGDTEPAGARDWVWLTGDARQLDEHTEVRPDLRLDVRALDLDDDLPAVRAAGYAQNESFTIAGVVNIAAPVRDMTGRVVAAITIPFVRRLSGTNTASIEEARHELLAMAAAISQRLGAGATRES